MYIQSPIHTMHICKSISIIKYKRKLFECVGENDGRNRVRKKLSAPVAGNWMIFFFFFFVFLSSSANLWSSGARSIVLPNEFSRLDILSHDSVGFRCELNCSTRRTLIDPAHRVDANVSIGKMHRFLHTNIYVYKCVHVGFM